MMKKSLFGLLAAAAVLPVSGAVVNYSWTGLNGTVVSGQITYTGSGDGAVELKSPVAQTTVIVDDNGFVIDYPGLAERI